MLLCVAVCCSVLRCDAVCVWYEAKDEEAAPCDEALAGSLVYVSVLRGFAGCCDVLPCVAVCCAVMQCVCGARPRIRNWHCAKRRWLGVWYVMQHVTACYSVLQRVAVCCSLLRCSAVCRRVCVVGPRVRMRRFYASVLHGIVVCCRVL